jgi:hypothetical protein
MSLLSGFSLEKAEMDRGVSASRQDAAMVRNGSIATHARTPAKLRPCALYWNRSDVIKKPSAGFARMTTTAPIVHRLRHAIIPGRAAFPLLKSRQDEAPSLGLTCRMRRNRKADWSRRLVRESALTTDDLIWPIFVMDRSEARSPVEWMPGVDRSIEEAVRRGGSGSPRHPRDRALPLCGQGPARSYRLRGAQYRQPDVPRRARDQARCPRSASSATPRSTPTPPRP